MTYSTFCLFYDAVKEQLTYDQLKALNPHFHYFEHSDGWSGLGISADRKALWVSIAVGKGPKLMREIREEAQRLGCETVGWLCRKDTPSYRIAEYYKADIKDNGERYEDGDVAFECWCPVKGGRNG